MKYNVFSLVKDWILVGIVPESWFSETSLFFKKKINISISIIIKNEFLKETRILVLWGVQSLVEWFQWLLMSQYNFFFFFGSKLETKNKGKKRETFE